MISLDDYEFIANFPENLKCFGMKRYSIDNALMIDVIFHNGFYYVHRSSVNDLQYVWKDENPTFLGKAKPTESYFVSRDMVAEDLKSATKQQKRLGD